MRTRVVALLVAVVSGCGGAETSTAAKSSTRPEPVAEPTRKVSPPPVDPRLILLTEHDERLRGILAQGFVAQRIDGACEVWKVEAADPELGEPARLVREYSSGDRRTVEWRTFYLDLASMSLDGRRSETFIGENRKEWSVHPCIWMDVHAFDSGSDFVRIGKPYASETWFSSLEACEAASSKLALGPRC